jgi:[histone H3]-lysine9 N-trimethyltransferase SUV39H
LQVDDEISTLDLPTVAMLNSAAKHTTHQAFAKVRVEFVMKMKIASQNNPPLDLVNTIDGVSPSLAFKFIDNYVYGKDVSPPNPAFFEGCHKPCRPNMGDHCGCEYTKLCTCLEYARVVEASLDDDGRKDYETRLANDKSTMGLPKKFPYEKGSGLLRPFYLDSRYPIYECNQNCNCGDDCKTRVVQRGRRVGLEIFKTRDRGWGLRCKEDLRTGQFIDLYKGEIVTIEEAEQRRKQAENSAQKDSYFYALDKFKDDCRNFHMERGKSEAEAEDAVYEVDGEFMGGPTRFINHSCDPNCRQYVICYDKNNPYLYHIAFFAIRPIPKGQELTFDYLDKDDVDDEEGGDVKGGEADREKEKTRCRCGAEKCRKWLWL